MDQMFIRDLSVWCIIGTKPDERVNKQEVLINLRMDCDLSRAGRTDRLEDTINFRDLEDRVVEFVEGSRFHLIERLAQRIAETCLEERRVRSVSVSVDKPRALRYARSAAVEIHRGRVTPARRR
jgi:dihydroneopterin aldolase/D-erythro-7,8-dihydroneopterin triphosphate epimerase